jgi:hypothetical protein
VNTELDFASDLLADGIRIRDRGLRVYPVGADKQPIRGHQWGPWRINPPAPDDQIRRWATDSQTHGWAVLCGACDDGIACLDIEADGMAVPEVAAITARAPTFCQYRSKSGGVHVWLDIGDHDTAGPMLTEPLAKVTNGDLDASGNLVWPLLAEIRGASPKPENNGAYAVVVGPGRPPLRDDWRPWKITRAEAEALLQPIRDLDQYGPWKAARNAERARNRATRPTVAPTGDTTASVILEALKSRWLDPTDVLPDGWEYVGDDGPRQLIRRPGGKSPVSGNVRDGITVVHSTAVEWATPGEGLAPALLLAEGRHGGDFAAAMLEVEKAARGESSDYSHWPRAVLDQVAEVAHNNRERWEAEQAAKITDWTAAAAAAAAAAPPTPEAEQDTAPEDGQPEAQRPYFADLTWLLTGQAPERPTPQYVRRPDGIGLFYAGKVNGIFGDPETGKSWITHAGAVEALGAGQRVAIIDADHNGPEATVSRLLALGADPSALADPDRFRYVEPEDRAAVIRAVVDLETWSPGYVVLDSLGELLPLLGAESNSNDDVTMALRAVTGPLLRSGACVVTVDHVVKNRDAGGGYAVGAGAKKRPIRGSYLRAAKITEVVPGKVGKVRLHIEKDTTGSLRRAGDGKHAGVFTLDATDPDRITWHIDLGASGEGGDYFRPTALMERVSRWMADRPGTHSRTAITTAVSGRKVNLETALDVLTRERFTRVAEVQVGGQRQRHYELVTLFTEAEYPTPPPRSHPGPTPVPGPVLHPSPDPATPVPPLTGGPGAGGVGASNQPKTAPSAPKIPDPPGTGVNIAPEAGETPLPTEDTDTATTSDHACAGPGVCRTSGCAASEQVA